MRRLDQLLANLGYCSRSEARDWIDSGAVTVRGEPADGPSQKAHAAPPIPNATNAAQCPNSPATKASFQFSQSGDRNAVSMPTAAKAPANKKRNTHHTHIYVDRPQKVAPGEKNLPALLHPRTRPDLPRTRPAQTECHTIGDTRFAGISETHPESRNSIPSTVSVTSPRPQSETRGSDPKPNPLSNLDP